MQTQTSTGGVLSTGRTDSTSSTVTLNRPFTQVAVWGGPFKAPYTLTAELSESGEYIVSEDLFLCYGVGEDLQEAVQDFAAMLRDSHAELERSEDRLSEALTKQLRIFRYFLIPIS